jgi:hypothetical protein
LGNDYGLGCCPKLHRLSPLYCFAEQDGATLVIEVLKDEKHVMV